MKAVFLDFGTMGSGLDVSELREAIAGLEDVLKVLSR